MSENSPKFTWGDSVLLVDPLEKYPEVQAGSVCGISEIKSQFMQKKYDQPLGSFVYTVEFAGGESMSIPECYLQKSKG